jgi:hypothetical protein
MSGLYLPSAPGQYTLRDQDEIRKILEHGLEDMISRIFELEQAPPPPTGNTTWLRAGLTGFGNGVIGLGPGDLPAPNPIYTFAGHYQPVPTTVDQDLQDASDNDVMLAMNLAGGRNGWAPGGVFDMNLWKSKVDRFAGNTALATAIENHSVYLMAIDEPNHPDFGTPSTITPTDVNNMGLYLKSVYPGAMVYVRTGSPTMVDGWSNINGEPSPPATGWTGIDYAYSQYAWSNNKTVTIANYYASEKSRLATVGLGMIPAFNFIDGGHYQDFDGIPACWDIDNNGVSSGIINGQRGNTTTPDGVHLNCGDPKIGQVGCRYLWSSPAWIRRAIDVAVTDPDALFFSGFIYTNDANTPPPAGQWQIDLQRRSDMVGALQYMIAKGKTRTTFNGLRTIK